MKLPKLNKGFTLIELLVVIAVLGILAAVVLVAINPAERMREASDSGVKNDVSQTASAVEACFTNSADGYYDDCLTKTVLVSTGYLKLEPDGADIAPAAGSDVANVVVYGALEALSAGTCVAPSANYWVYRSATGGSAVECLAATPTP